MARPSFGGGPPSRPVRQSGFGSRIRRTAATLAGLIALLVGFGLPGSPAWARPPEVLTPAAIKEFEQKLNTARAAQSVIAGRVVCFEQQEAALVKERDADQRRLGELVAHKRELEVTTVRQKNEYDGFMRLYEQERNNINQKREELHRLYIYRSAKQQALETCRRQMGPLGFLCNVSKDIAEATGMIEKTDQQIVVAERRFEEAAAGMRQAQENYDRSAAALARSQEDTARTEREIRTAEASISRLQTTLAILRPQVHDNKVLLDDFANALNEAKRDARGPSARTVRTLAAQVDEATRRSNALLTQAKTVLTEQQFATCFR